MSDQANEVPASNLFEAELGRQIVASERERASLQAAIGVALLLIVGVVTPVDIAEGESVTSVHVRPADGGDRHHLRARHATVV